jgi:hypothetical protein
MSAAVRDFFASLGWRDYGHQTYKDADLYGLRIEGTPCACNDKLYLHAAHYVFENNGQRFESLEFDITAENADGQWFSLKAYGNRPDDLTAERVEQVRASLLAAWEAVQVTQTVAA